MTLIAALQESSDAILIAADSGQTETPEQIRFLTDAKLRRHNTPPIAWGCSGSTTAGDRLSDWMEALDEPADWHELSDRVSAEVARINGRQREIATIAKSPRASVISVLLAGWLHGGGNILVVDDTATADSYAREGIAAIGAAKGAFLIASITLRQISGIAPSQKFALATDVAARGTPQCDPPVHVWRLGRTAIDVLPLA